MDDICRTILKFNKHPSIIKIRENMNTNDSFSFSNTSLNNIESKITNLNINKPTTSNNIPAKILVGYKDIYSKFIVTFYNNCIFESSFPDTMKMADITPAHKKFMRISSNIWETNSHPTYVVSVRVILHNTV